MRAQLITLDLVGLALRGLWKLSCAAILYFLADAVFYQGDWLNVGYAALMAGVMYYVSTAYDAAFAEFTRKAGAREEIAQQEFRFTAFPKRRGMAMGPMQQAVIRPMTSNDYARMG